METLFIVPNHFQTCEQEQNQLTSSILDIVYVELSYLYGKYLHVILCLERSVCTLNCFNDILQISQFFSVLQGSPGWERTPQKILEANFIITTHWKPDSVSHSLFLPLIWKKDNVGLLLRLFCLFCFPRWSSCFVNGLHVTSASSMKHCLIFICSPLHNPFISILEEFCAVYKPIQATRW